MRQLQRWPWAIIVLVTGYFAMLGFLGYRFLDLMHG